MKIIKQTYFIHAPIDTVWEALVNESVINAWGGGPAKMDDKEGTEFTLWGGSIWGTNKKVEPKKSLKQEWYSDEEQKWDKASLVTFTLYPEKNTVRLDLLHEDVPDADARNIEDGWKEYYLGPLKEYLESKH